MSGIKKRVAIYQEEELISSEAIELLRCFLMEFDHAKQGHDFWYNTFYGKLRELDVNVRYFEGFWFIEKVAKVNDFLAISFSRSPENPYRDDRIGGAEWSENTMKLLESIYGTEKVVCFGSSDFCNLRHYDKKYFHVCVGVKSPKDVVESTFPELTDEQKLALIEKNNQQWEKLIKTENNFDSLAEKFIAKVKTYNEAVEELKRQMKKIEDKKYCDFFVDD